MPETIANKTVQSSERHAWYVVAILMLAYASSMVDRQILALLIEPIKRDFKVSDTQMGLLIGFSFSLFYALMGIPIGRLVDRKSRKNIIAVGVCFWSLMTALCGITGSYWQLFLARMGVGVGEATLSPAANSLISDYFPKEKLGTAMSVYSVGIYIGFGLSMLIGGVIIKLIGIEGLWHLPLVGDIYPWQSVFFIVGIPGFLIVLLLKTVKEPLRKELLFNKNAQENTASFGDVIQYFKANITTFLCLFVGLGFMAFTVYANAAWIPSFFIRVHGWTASKAGLTYGTIVMICSSLGVLSGGRLGDYFSKKGIVSAKMLAGCIGMGFTLLASIGVLMPHANYVLPFLVISCFFSSFPQGAGIAALQEIVPNNMRGTFTSFFMLVFNLIGLGLGPLCVGLLNDKLFHDPTKINYSLFITVLSGATISVILLFIGRKYFEQTTIYLKTYLSEK